MSRKSKETTNNPDDLVGTLRKLWNDEFLPTIRKELQLELSTINNTIKLLNERCQEIEDSQSLINNKFEHQKTAIQETKKEMNKIQDDVRQIQDNIYQINEDLTRGESNN